MRAMPRDFREIKVPLLAILAINAIALAVEAAYWVENPEYLAIVETMRATASIGVLSATAFIAARKFNRNWATAGKNTAITAYIGAVIFVVPFFYIQDPQVFKLLQFGVYIAKYNLGMAISLIAEILTRIVLAVLLNGTLGFVLGAIIGLITQKHVPRKRRRRERKWRHQQ